VNGKKLINAFQSLSRFLGFCGIHGVELQDGRCFDCDPVVHPAHDYSKIDLTKVGQWCILTYDTDEPVSYGRTIQEAEENSGLTREEIVSYNPTKYWMTKVPSIPKYICGIHGIELQNIEDGGYCPRCHTS
jgi:hypothetical protein